MDDRLGSHSLPQRESEKERPASRCPRLPLSPRLRHFDRPLASPRHSPLSHAFPLGPAAISPAPHLRGSYLPRRACLRMATSAHTYVSDIVRPAPYVVSSSSVATTPPSFLSTVCTVSADVHAPRTDTRPPSETCEAVSHLRGSSRATSRPCHPTCPTSVLPSSSAVCPGPHIQLRAGLYRSAPPSSSPAE